MSTRAALHAANVATHAVIVCKHSAASILAGTKTVESRLTLTRREPWGMVAAGDVLLFKISSGPYVARARVQAVACFEGLTPPGIAALARAWEARVLGGAEYWRKKRTARYATLLTLADVTPISTGPNLGITAGRAWVRLSAAGKAQR